MDAQKEIAVNTFWYRITKAALFVLLGAYGFVNYSYWREAFAHDRATAECSVTIQKKDAAIADLEKKASKQAEKPPEERTAFTLNCVFGSECGNPNTKLTDRWFCHDTEKDVFLRCCGGRLVVWQEGQECPAIEPPLVQSEEIQDAGIEL